MTDYLGPQHVTLPNGDKRGPGIGRDLPNNALPIITIDPGGTTGWSLLVLKREVLGRNVFDHPLEMILRSKMKWDHGEIDCRQTEDQSVYSLRKLIDEWPSAAVVIEDFILRTQRREQSRELLSPVRITAKLEHHLWLCKRKMFLQQPAMAKRMTDERLKQLGVYSREGGLQHARDADRHAIMFIRRCMDGAKGVVLQEQSWPNVFSS